MSRDASRWVIVWREGTEFKAECFDSDVEAKIVELGLKVVSVRRVDVEDAVAVLVECVDEFLSADTSTIGERIEAIQCARAVLRAIAAETPDVEFTCRCGHGSQYHDESGCTVWSGVGTRCSCRQAKR